MSAIKVGVITVSDTASVDAAADRSGPTIQEIVRQRGHGCTRSIILPDDEQQIRETVKNWCYDVENPVDWIISTGGTGFGVRDRTPEVDITHTALSGTNFLLSRRLPPCWSARQQESSIYCCPSR
jgi:molybdenum cofactor synthesis domain-containing protein